MKITSQEDFWGGVVFIAFGALAIYIASDYPFGTAARMGPGFFPTWIGIVLIVLGTAIAATGFKNQGEGIGQFAWKAMAMLSVGFIIFGWAIDHVGFVIALSALVVAGAAAGQEFRYKEVIVLTIALVVGSWALFIKGLDLPFPLFWWR